MKNRKIKEGCGASGRAEKRDCNTAVMRGWISFEKWIDAVFNSYQRANCFRDVNRTEDLKEIFLSLVVNLR